jgi:hypothetical protein
MSRHTRAFLLLSSALCLAVVVSEARGLQSPVLRPAPQASALEYRALLDRYCVPCHSARLKTAGLVLEGLDLSDVSTQTATWEKVARRLRARMMPPLGAPKPDEGARQALVSWLEAALDASAAAHPRPGKPLLHRLNRTEYANAVRDLLDVDVDVTRLLPPDDPSSGFDNIADTLGVSPALTERYLAAARKVSALAVGDTQTAPASTLFRTRQDLSQHRHLEGLPIGTVGGLLARVTLPLDAEYIVQPRLFRTSLGVTRGLEYPHRLEISVDGERVHLASFGGDVDFRASLANSTKLADEVDARLRVRLSLRAGPHAIAVAFLEKSGALGTSRLQPFVRSSTDPIDHAGVPHLDTLLVTGPFDARGSGDSPSRRRIFVCRPGRDAEETSCATRILSTLARRAYRGSPTQDQLRRVMAAYREARKTGTFDAGIQTAVERILASPLFIFRPEAEPPRLAAGSVYQISDLELASRLSFFLWSSIPDDRLLDLAEQRTLSQPGILAGEVRRMLADPRMSLVSNFASQWLYLRNLRSQVPDSNEFPDFDDNLRQAFLRETEMFIDSLIREDRSVLELLTADHTFVNERLARHYGLPHVYGSQMRRVTVADQARRGLLGQGSVLMVTSHVDRTSPVVRGKWILENILGTPPPPPPPNVPPLENSDSAKARTMRQRMEAHRANPACAACHRVMDPIGLSLENFDAVGAWRARDGGVLIDATGQLTDGTPIDGPIQLRKALLRDPEMFVRTLTEKLLTYAIGRGLTHEDMPAVRGIVRQAAQGNYRFSALLDGIVNSAPFRSATAGVGDAVNRTSAAR